MSITARRCFFVVIVLSKIHDGQNRGSAALLSSGKSKKTDNFSLTTAFRVDFRQRYATEYRSPVQPPGLAGFGAAPRLEVSGGCVPPEIKRPSRMVFPGFRLTAGAAGLIVPAPAWEKNPPQGDFFPTTQPSLKPLWDSVKRKTRGKKKKPADLLCWLTIGISRTMSPALGCR